MKKKCFNALFVRVEQLAATGNNELKIKAAIKGIFLLIYQRFNVDLMYVGGTAFSLHQRRSVSAFSGYCYAWNTHKFQSLVFFFHLQIFC